MSAPGNRPHPTDLLLRVDINLQEETAWPDTPALDALQRDSGAAQQGGLTSCRIARMVFHMKTTLVIDDTVVARLREESARTGRTQSEIVEAALRRIFQPTEAGMKKLAPLPAFDSGGCLVDVADRGALYDAMGGRR